MQSAARPWLLRACAAWSRSLGWQRRRTAVRGFCACQPGPYQPVQSVQHSSERLLGTYLFETCPHCRVRCTCCRSAVELQRKAAAFTAGTCIRIFAPYTASQTGGPSRLRAEHPRNSSTAADEWLTWNAESWRPLLSLSRCPGYSSSPGGPPARKQTCRARIQGVGVPTRGCANSWTHADMHALGRCNLTRFTAAISAGMELWSHNAMHLAPSRLWDRRQQQQNSSKHATALNPAVLCCHRPSHRSPFTP